MARMEWSLMGSVRPAAWLERNRRTELDIGMETAGVEERCRAKQDIQTEE